MFGCKNRLPGPHFCLEIFYFIWRITGKHDRGYASIDQIVTTTLFCVRIFKTDGLCIELKLISGTNNQ